MNTRSSPALAAVLDELTAAGATYTVTRNRHCKIRWELDGRKGVAIIPFTASDWRAPMNARADVRRQLRGGTPR
jgi:hypothetical protein